MNNTRITLNGSQVDVKFGMWTLARLSDRGYKMTDFQKALSDNPIDFIHALLFLGACNANDRDLSAYDEGLFWDYLDENGIHSAEVSRALKCFTDSLVQDVPKEEKKSRTKVIGMPK